MTERTTAGFRPDGRVVLAAVAAFLYYGAVALFSVNVPVGDDYALLGFLNEYQNAGSTAEKLRLLFSFHNEHRIVVTRLAVLACTYLTGSLDFRLLNLAGNAFLLLTLLTIGSMLRLRGDTTRWALLFLIALLLQPLKLMFYPMAALQAYGGLLFSILFLYFTLREKRWYPALVLYLLAVLTTGSGIFLVCLGIPLALLTKRYLQAATYAAFSLPVLLLYAPRSSGLPYLLEHPGAVLKFFLLLMGSVAQLPMLGSPVLQIGCGLVLLACCARVVWEGCRRPDRGLAAAACLLYLLMVIALIAGGRAALYDQDLWGASLDGRYRIYSLMVAAICCIEGVGKVGGGAGIAGRLPAVAVTLALLFNLIWSVPSLVTLRFESQRRVLAMQQWQQSGDVTVLPIWSTPPEDAQAELSAAVRRGLYRP